MPMTYVERKFLNGVIFVFTDDQIKRLWDDALETSNPVVLLLCDISLRLSALEKLYSGKDSGGDGGHGPNNGED